MLVIRSCHILSTAVALLYILEQSCSYKYDEAVVYRQSLYKTTIIHMYMLLTTNNPVPTPTWVIWEAVMPI